MINFSQIQIFLAVVEAGGFIAAAEKIHRSQPSITNSIKKLEEQIGFNLFDRSQYRPQLTAKGEFFYQKAKEMFKQISGLENSIALLRSGIETQFFMDMDISLPLSNYLPLIQSLIQCYPHTCFSLINNNFVKCIDRLKNKLCNICIAASNRQDPSIEYLPMPSFHMIPVASKTYYNKHRKQLEEQNHSTPCMQIMIADTEQELQQLQIEPLSTFMPKWLVSDMYTRKMLILSDMGIGRLPEHMIEKELTNGSLLQLKNFLPVAMRIYAMRLIQREHGIIANHAWQALKDLSIN